MAYSPSARGRGLSGLGPLGELPGGALGARPRGTRGGLGSIRGFSRQGYSGTGVLLGGLPDEAYGLGTRGQVACSEASGGSLTHSALGFFRGHVAHSQASVIVSLAGLHGALGSFREACGALGDTCRAPKVGPKGGFGMARSEGGFRASFRDKCHTPKVSERMFRRSFEGVFRQVFATASKRVSGHAALSEGLRKGVLRCGTSRRWFSKGSPRGMLRAGCRRGLPEEFGSEGGFRRRFRRGSSERVLRRVSERVSSKEVAKGSSGRASGRLWLWSLD